MAKKAQKQVKETVDPALAPVETVEAVSEPVETVETTPEPVVEDPALAPVAEEAKEQAIEVGTRVKYPYPEADSGYLTGTVYEVLEGSVLVNYADGSIKALPTAIVEIVE